MSEMEMWVQDQGVQLASFLSLIRECGVGNKTDSSTRPEKFVFCWGEAQMESGPWK